MERGTKCNQLWVPTMYTLDPLVLLEIWLSVIAFDSPKLGAHIRFSDKNVFSVSCRCKVSSFLFFVFTLLTFLDLLSQFCTKYTRRQGIQICLWMFTSFYKGRSLHTKYSTPFIRNIYIKSQNNLVKSFQTFFLSKWTMMLLWYNEDLLKLYTLGNCCSGQRRGQWTLFIQ